MFCGVKTERWHFFLLHFVFPSCVCVCVRVRVCVCVYVFIDIVTKLNFLPSSSLSSLSSPSSSLPMSLAAGFVQKSISPLPLQRDKQRHTICICINKDNTWITTTFRQTLEGLLRPLSRHKSPRQPTDRQSRHQTETAYWDSQPHTRTTRPRKTVCGPLGRSHGHSVVVRIVATYWQSKGKKHPFVRVWVEH